ncbi:UPF0052-domain-containing protein [Ascodesmis nigricans]|uniref:UPF0052-domain-containing protein n=1 Tax=Ascodesmis nigricans TaxID=341454 RepID=A0A4S2N4X4_9PEZI|nr:UPF0052-domain-containing protein [Ascodesmis nigricans]
MSTRKRIVVFSGGSAANNLIDVFTALCRDKPRGLDFVLPISDNGGSTSEILRVFGGPSIGDVRSRLIRLVPEDEHGPERVAIKGLLNHRLASENDAAKAEWYAIVEGRHELWSGISPEKRELIRSFFSLLNHELTKRTRPSSSFNFQSASLGNLFLTGARIFTGSFESAIYLFHSITGIPDYISVIPAINSNFAHHIAAGLEDGTVIVGQNQISHPSPEHALPVEFSNGYTDSFTLSNASGSLIDSAVEEDDEEYHDSDHEEEDANLPGSLKELRRQNIEFSKTDEKALSSPIERIWYINPYGQEIRPAINPKVIASLKQSEAIIYSIGSLYTSLIPCLVLRNLGNTILSTNPSTPKILLLNGSHDRETGPNQETFTALSFIRAVVRACLNCASVSPDHYRRIVTHVIYLEGNGAPRVEIEELKKLGIEPIRVYGRRNPAGAGKGMLYDPAPLLQSLYAILGTRRMGVDTRRNTVNGVVGVRTPRSVSPTE